MLSSRIISYVALLMHFTKSLFHLGQATFIGGKMLEKTVLCIANVIKNSIYKPLEKIAIGKVILKTFSCDKNQIQDGF